MFFLIFLVIPFVFIDTILRIYRKFFPAPKINPDGRFVLITGCDSGFGQALAITLSRQGYYVFAGILDNKNEEDLRRKLSPETTIFQLDITKQRDIDRALDLVKAKTNSLHALVNNAGISTSGPIDWIPMESMRKIMEVNFFGHVAITKTFIPLLIAKRDSRVVNLCSVAGIITSPLKGAYSASKYALEAFSDCLRREMAPWKLRVSIVEPGPMRTPIIQGHDRYMQDFWNNLTADVKQRWGEDFLRVQIDKLANNFLYRHAEDPQLVVNALEHAVSNSKPEIRYRPGWQATYLFFPMSMAPTWLVDWFFRGMVSSGLKPLSSHQMDSVKNE